MFSWTATLSLVRAPATCLTVWVCERRWTGRGLQTSILLYHGRVCAKRTTELKFEVPDPTNN